MDDHHQDLDEPGAWMIREGQRSKAAVGARPSGPGRVAGADQWARWAEPRLAQTFAYVAQSWPVFSTRLVTEGNSL